MNESDRLQEGQLFGRYKIVRLLGEGGMGAVYEAVHVVLKKRVALKTLLPSVAQIPEARARFLREAEAASRINHPHVVDVSDVGAVDDLPFLVMEFLEGEPLSELMAARGRLDVADAVDLLLPVISAVAAGHDQGVIHRDLKPQNVFLARGPWGEATPKVLDFGASKLVELGDNVALTATMTVLGTAAYMSPEQARGARQVDKQSDQYALGLILYEMITGDRAHPGENALEVIHNITTTRLKAPRDLRPELPVELEFVLLRMLAPVPGDRHPSLRAAGRELLPFASDQTRLNMKGAFREPTAPGAPDPRAAAAAPEQASAGPGSGRVITMIADPADTTLRRTAAENQTVEHRPASRGPLVAAVLGLAGAAAIATGVWLFDERHPAAPPAAAREAAGPSAAPSVAFAPPVPAADELREARPPVPKLALDVTVIPAEADIALDGTPVGQGHLAAKLPADGRKYKLTVSAKGYQTRVITFGTFDEPPTEVRLQRETARGARPRRKAPAAPDEPEGASSSPEAGRGEAPPPGGGAGELPGGK